MAIKRFSVSQRLILFSISLIILSVGISSFVVYKQIKRNLETSLAAELQAIVNSTAPSLSGNLIKEISIDENGNLQTEEPFEILREQLIGVKKWNQFHNSVNPIYALTPADDYEKSNEFVFSVLTDPISSGKFAVGHRYPAKPFLVDAMNGKAGNTGLYEDDLGLWISAAAPIFDTNQQIVGILQADRPVNSFYPEVQRESLKILLSALIGIIPAALLAVLLARSFVRPLQEIVKATNQIGQWKMNARVNLKRRDEFGDLADSFNSMADELERSHAEVAEKIRENIAAREFLANMSHELRTPLNAIIGYSEMLIEDAEDQDNSDAIPDLDKIRVSGVHLLGLINDILDISKIEAGKVDLLLETIDLQDLLDEVTSTVKPLIKKNQNRLGLKCDKDISTMFGDITRLRQILFNLLSNAAKFTDRGEVVLTCSRKRRDDDRDWISFAVEDTGIGISEEKIDKILEPFVQANNRTTREYGGTGLGLTITKRFTEMMGGHMEVSSKNGEGSTFTIHLPAEVEDVRPHLSRMSAPKSTEDLKKPAAVIQPSRKEKTIGKVLLVDDDPEAVHLLTRILTKSGYEVICLSDGNSTIESARLHQPDIITLDIMMPGDDGWKLLGELKSDSELKEIPVVVVSVIDATETGMVMGAADCLTKPINKAEFLKTLEKHRLKKHRASILVVDPEPAYRLSLIGMLSKKGWKVGGAENADTALHYLGKNNCDLVVIEIDIPLTKGLEFIDNLRSQPKFENLPIVVYTKAKIPKTMEECLQKNVRSVLLKIDHREDLLMENIRETLSSHLVESPDKQ